MAENRKDQLLLQRQEWRAQINVQKGEIRETQASEWNEKADKKAIAIRVSQMQFELKDLEDGLELVDIELDEIEAEIREERQDKRRAKRKVKTADLERDLEAFVKATDLIVTALEKVVDDKNVAERIGALMAKVAGASAGAMAKCEVAAKEAVKAAKGQPAMTLVS